ncbi:MAG: hypothetical protein E6G32_10255, partial [Actinobacteria bacterium]
MSPSSGRSSSISACTSSRSRSAVSRRPAGSATRSTS